ncbi:MAG: alpha/beta hydrolase [Pararhodobacter sp.]|nr:alpha/beta hydrolase [Pararhodobacter sp.]
MTDPLKPIRAVLAARIASWAGMDLAAIRSDFAAFMAEVGPAGFAQANPCREEFAGVPGAWVGATQAPAALYLHGGGFQIGGTDSHAGLAARLAETTGLRLFLPEYRLAPEHRFPAAINDAFGVYEAMIERGAPPVAVMGDSAGGALALLCAKRARDRALRMPDAVILLSPWLDLSLSGDSYARLAGLDPFSKPAQLQAMARTYLGRDGPPPGSPEVSPLFSSLEGLPPVLIHAGGHDITLDDARALKALWGAAVTLVEYPMMCHHFQMFEALHQTADSLAAIGGWWRKR